MSSRSCRAVAMTIGKPRARMHEPQLPQHVEPRLSQASRCRARLGRRAWRLLPTRSNPERHSRRRRRLLRIPRRSSRRESMSRLFSSSSNDKQPRRAERRCPAGWAGKASHLLVRPRRNINVRRRSPPFKPQRRRRGNFTYTQQSATRSSRRFTPPRFTSAAIIYRRRVQRCSSRVFHPASQRRNATSAAFFNRSASVGYG